MYPFCVNACSQVAKILKNPLCGSENCYSNGENPVLVLFFDLVLHFKGQSFGLSLDLQISRKEWDRANITVAIRKSGICHRMAPLQMLFVMTFTYIFKVIHFLMWIFRKSWGVTFVDVDIRRRTANGECCTPWHWSSFSRSNIFLLCICYKINCTGSERPRHTSLESTASAVELLLFFFSYTMPLLAIYLLEITPSVRIVCAKCDGLSLLLLR